jgi:lipoate-protein ligase A
MNILKMLEFEELILRHTTDNYLIINYGEAPADAPDAKTSTGTTTDTSNSPPSTVAESIASVTAATKAADAADKNREISKRDKHTSIVLGFSGKAHLLIDIPKVIEDDITVLRRYTGGGTVIVDSSTCFVALIMNSNEADCQPYPREIMTWTDEKVRPSISTNYLHSASYTALNSM